MTSESRHIGERIDRPADEVYEYASDRANLLQWAPGLGSSVKKVDDRWFVESSEGRFGFAFIQRNEYWVYNPMRVIADESGCEAVFTLRRRPGMNDEDFRADAAAVAADITGLKQVLERR